MDADNHTHGLTPEDRMAEFERLLRANVDPRGLDFAETEARLFARIRRAEMLGPLAEFKADRIPPSGFWDRIEAGLMARIAAHYEYDAPVNDCIVSHESLDARSWSKIECGLDARMGDAARRPLWEQVLKAPEVPTPGFWEEQEKALLGRLEGAQAVDWERLLAEPEVFPAEGVWEMVEAGLGRRIRALEGLPEWEQALKAEVHPTPDAWEYMEYGLWQRIEKENRLRQLSPRPLWLNLGLYAGRAVRTAVALALATAAVFFGWRLQAGPTTVETLVYKVQGQSLEDLRRADASRESFRSREAGALTVVNERGFVEMQNGSGIEIEEASRSRVHYRAGLSGAHQGKITFFVKPRRGGEKYIVSTDDYRIEVVGTYFQVQPDLESRVSTAVLEGEVRIISEDFGERILVAGQSLVYDVASRAYRVQDGGTVVPRHEIEKLPEVETLREYELLTVESDVPGAEVRIDGRYKGLTPLAILQLPGEHVVWIGKDGYRSVDTVIRVAEGGESRLAAALLPTNRRAVALGAPRRRPGVETAVSGGQNERAAPAGKLAGELDSASTDSAGARAAHLDAYRRAEEVQATDWRLAIRLYEKVLEDPAAPRLRKEAALFSIARLRADHASYKARAREDFLQYLALYPSGAFAGECWLRLAELEFGPDPDKAVDYYLKYFEKYPRHHRVSELQHRVGLIYLQQGKPDKAVSMFRQSLANMNGGSEEEIRKVYAGLHKALELQGDAEAARHIRDRFLRPETGGH